MDSVWSGVTANSVPTIKGKLGLPPGNHVISVSGNQFYGLDVEAQILGDGGFTKNGLAGLLVRGNNTFNGDLTVAQGILAAAHNNAFGSVAGFTVVTNDGVLILNDVDVYGESLFSRGNRVFSAESAGAWVEAVGTNLWSGPIILDSHLILTSFGASRLNLNGLISGAAGLHCLGGVVEISGTDANTFPGGVLAQNPLLLLNKSAGVAAFGGPLRVGGGDASQKEVRWLQDYQRVGAEVTLFWDGLVNLNNHRDDFGPVTFNAGTIATGASGELGLYGLLMVNPSSSPAFISGRLGLPPGLREFLVGDGAAFPDLRIDATVLGAGHWRKTGPGQMWLTAANTYSGLTTVAAGAVSVLHPNGLGAVATGTTVNDGATLELNFAGTMPEPLAIRGTGYTGNGALGVFNNVTLRTPQPSIFAAIDLTTNATIGIADSSQLTVDGTISGTGHLTKAGAGTLWFGGNDHNTYSGETFINEGILIMGKPTATTAVPAPLNIGTSSRLLATAANVASYQVIGNIFVNRTGVYNLNGQVENVDHLWLTEGGDVQTSPPGVLFLKAGGSIQVLPGTVSNPATISGLLEIEAGAHTFNVAATSGLTAGGPDLDLTAQVTSSGGAITFNKTGAGKLRFSANNLYTGSTVVNAGTVQVDGVQTASSTLVHSGARLSGIGRVGTVNFAGSSGVLSPGNSAGVFETGLFNPNTGGGILEVELNGPTAGSDYDRLRVTGSVNLTGMKLQALVNFTAATNTPFAIVVNDLSDPIIGTFTGLPEGANVIASDQVFQITYAGGTGNDVVLTKLADVFRPKLTIEYQPPASVRLLWPTSAPPFSLQSKTNLNDTNWIAATPPPVVVGTNNVVTNAAAGERRFYRLSSP
jgi:autotransporter-associated beta strand protein